MSGSGPSAVAVMSADDIRRAISRIAHEIVERNQGIDGVVLVGLQRGGTWIADALGSRIADIEPQSEVIVGRLDVSMYRDDIGMRPVVAGAVSDIPRDITDAVVVLVDRGHRELPIRPDFVGKNLPTHATDEVSVTAEGVTVVGGERR